MLILGVDPGLTGAMALLCNSRGLLECSDLPTCANGQASGKMLRWLDGEALRATLGDWSTRHGFAQEAVHACIERPIPMPTLPAQTVASQFDSFGVIRALVGSRVQPGGLTVVEPRHWKKLFGLGSDKDDSRATAVRLYPSADKLLARKRDHNRAEAVLLAHWLMREVAS